MANECSNSENLFPAYNQHEDLNLEKQKNKEIQRLEVISQNLEKNLKILEVDEIDNNTINVFKENNEQKNCNINNNRKTFALNYSKGLDVRVLVGLDFGVTYSGFAYCHVNDDYQDIHTNDIWPMVAALRPSKNRKQNSEPVKLFKLYLGDLSDNLKPKLPIDYKKAITDYLREIGMVIKGAIECRWGGIDYFEDVLLVLTIPAEYSEIDKVIIRQCVYNADLIKDRDSEKLQFTTESKATALYCVKHCFKQTFMFVDCGKYTTDLTTRKLDRNNPLHIDKVTTYNKDFCGSRLINEEFIKFLRERLGTCAIDLLKENNYNKLQYMVKNFHQYITSHFTDDDKKFQYDIEIEPTLLQYVSEETREIMEYNELIINIKYDDIKKMFDTLIDRIIRLIHIQLLNDKENCSAIFLTGDFCVNK
ncbi:unnamed protein product [Rhizophagus irregularis]|nr:unnamed protein product [Rhizophagus irregularis]